MTETMGPPDINRGKTAPLFLCMTIGEMERDKLELISSSVHRNFELRFLGIRFQSPDYVKVLIPNIGHFPEDDTGLPDNQIVVNDGIDSLAVDLPSGLQLSRINEYRRLAGLGSIGLSDLRDLQWRGQIVLFNRYQEGKEDKYTLIDLSESTIQAREESRSYQMEEILLQGI